MKSKQGGAKSCGVLKAAVWAMSIAGTLAPTVGAADYDRLTQVAHAANSDYPKLRDEVLRDMTQEWDLVEASRDSWRSGLAAFILNQRKKYTEEFARMDQMKRRLRASGHMYDLAGEPCEPSIAFLWEKSWRDGRTWNDLSLRNCPRCGTPGEIAVWRAIWDDAENEGYRRVAIKAMACLNDAPIDERVRRVLSDRQYDGLMRTACLQALRPRDPAETALVILENWNNISTNPVHLELAIGILGRDHSAAAREKLAAIAMDPARIPRERAQAIAWRGDDPEPEDAALFIRFLRSDAASTTKQEALRRGRYWPVERIRPVVRSVFENETDRGLISEAMAALARCHLHADPMGTATDPETPEDIRLIDAAIERIGSPEGMKRSRDFCVRTIEGYRGPLVGDKWPWERHPPQP